MSDKFCQELTIVPAEVNVQPPVLKLKAPKTGLNPTENNVIEAFANWVLEEATEYELSWSSISKAGKHSEVYIAAHKRISYYSVLGLNKTKRRFRNLSLQS